MPLEPRLRPLLAVANRFAKEPSSILEARGGDSWPPRLAAAVQGRPAKLRSVKDYLMAVDGGQISVRVYRPFGAGPLPLHLFLHGGGWALGTVAERDIRCGQLAADAGCAVASVDYRLAPEHKFPGPPEDCYAALLWLVEEAAMLDIDPARLTIGGESAGGNLAAVVCLMARDRRGPRLALQLLDVPATDLTLSQPSTHTLAQGYVLTRPAMERYVDWYLAEPGQAKDPYASPLHAEDLSGLPPAVITTCEYDPLRDEGEAYGRRLSEAGVPTVLRRLQGHVHISFTLRAILPSAEEHHQFCVRSLREAFTGR